MLGFDGDLQEIPPLRVIKQKFRKESLIKHPDKPEGDKEAFQELLCVYNKIISLLRTREGVNEEDSDDTEDEDEEMLAKKYFNKYGLYGN